MKVRFTWFCACVALVGMWLGGCGSDSGGGDGASGSDGGPGSTTGADGGNSGTNADGGGGGGGGKDGGGGTTDGGGSTDGGTDGGAGTDGGSPSTSLQASNAITGSHFGGASALSADGNTLAVGATGDASNATGINGAEGNTSDATAGAVFVYTRSGAGFTKQAYVKASNTGTGAYFGYAVALSADGNTLAVGAYHENNSASGINQNPALGFMQFSGAVYVFTRTGVTWTQQAYIKASNPAASTFFGASVALSGDGNTLVAGSTGEQSAATGVGGNQSDTSLNNAGAAYVFTRSGATWTQQAYIKASNTAATMVFGNSAALSTDGSTLVVGALNEASNATGIGGVQNDFSASNAGAAYVFTRSGATWTQQAYVKASNTRADGHFGKSVSLAGDGNTLAVGADGDTSNAKGVNGNQADTSLASAGAAYVFTRAAATWSQQAYVKASNTQLNAFFGTSVRVSTDGNTLAVGAPGEASNATGINGNQNDTSASGAGATYVLTRAGTAWSQQKYVKSSSTTANDGFGSSVSLSGDASTLAVGAPGKSVGASPNAGALEVF